MGAFRRALETRDPRGRRFIFVPYDQLTGAVGPLSREDPRELGIIVVECPGKAARRPYHRQKLAFVLTSLRHFAVEQAARGVAVRHVVSDSYAAALEPLAAELGEIRMMRPAERELRAELAPLIESGKLTQIDHEGWLTTTDDFLASVGEKAWRMDAFYRQVRRRLGYLMEKGKPIGGQFSFDADNRKAWKGDPPAPAAPTFAVDAITREVCDLITSKLAHHPGNLHPENIPATHEDVERAWTWAKASCLHHFGPFEDAMSTHSRGLFHTRISPLLNLQRLSAKRVVEEVVALEGVPFSSKEGFIRQMIGWREYVRHVHDATDGFRVIRGAAQPVAERPGDGGHGGWSETPWPSTDGGDGGSLTSVLGASRKVPPAYWGKRSGLHCLDEVIAAVWDEGYNHHIQRLMVLSNLAMLLDLSPREVTDWFWVAYIDAYDWVVEPNVHGMGTFGVGDLLTTKPYIAGSAYIHKMSNYCEGCRFDPKTTCPFPSMYWAFLGRHREALGRVDRMKLPVLAESRRSAEQKERDAAVFEKVSRTLSDGEELSPGQTSLPGTR